MNIVFLGIVYKCYYWRKSQGWGFSCSSLEISDDDFESWWWFDKDSGFIYFWYCWDSSEGFFGSEGDGGGQSKLSNVSGGVDKVSFSENNVGGGSFFSGLGGNFINILGIICCCVGFSSFMQLVFCSVGEFVESFKFMSFCFGFQFYGSIKYIIDLQNGLLFFSVKV